MNSIKIAWLFPDTLYLHGERGNILALKHFISLSGLTCTVDKIDFDTTDFLPENYDIIFCPPGEISSFPAILEWLTPYTSDFKKFIESGKILLATGTSVALWCNNILRSDNSTIKGLEIVDATVKEKSAVYGDDLYYKCVYGDKEIEIFGSQIQMIDFVEEKTPAFGKLIYGYGNSGANRNEGFKINNAIFTNTLGPILAINPDLTVEIVKLAAKNKNIEISEIPYNKELSMKSFESKKAFTLSKVTKLTNCK